jgi:hypothetical protein
MAWGSVNISYTPTGYTQNYKRNHVANHEEAQEMVKAAMADSVARVGKGVKVDVNNIRQDMGADPGNNYRLI